MSVWDLVPGQDRAVSLLSRDLSVRRVTHAYLFNGPAGRAPLVFAAALVCPEDGCGQCDTCARVLRRAHPDVEMIEPAGTQMLIDQVRDVVREAWRRPVAAARRVIVIEGADRMNPNAQNALLKGLEEAPGSTVIILAAPSSDALLETVRSRCREVTFRPLTEVEVAAVLAAEGVADATLWARVGGGLDRARTLATDEAERERRETVVERILRQARDAGDALEAAEWLAAQGRQVREEVAAEQKAQAELSKDWVRETKRASEDRVRREQRRAEQDALEHALDDATSVLRDLLALCSDDAADVLNAGMRSALAARAARLTPERVLRALAEVGEVRRRLRANANVTLQLERMFLAVHDELG